MAMVVLVVVKGGEPVYIAENNMSKGYPTLGQTQLLFIALICKLSEAAKG